MSKLPALSTRMRHRKEATYGSSAASVEEGRRKRWRSNKSDVTMGKRRRHFVARRRAGGLSLLHIVPLRGRNLMRRRARAKGGVGQAGGGTTAYEDPHLRFSTGTTGEGPLPAENHWIRRLYVVVKTLVFGRFRRFRGGSIFHAGESWGNFSRM